MNVYFITGATGAVGSALVPVLLQDSEVQVRLLIRAKNDEMLRQRLDDLFRFWAFGEQEASYRDRVRGLMGDAADPHFGLDEAAYGDLSRSVTHIVHSAGAVRMNLPIDDARRSAVTSAERIIELAYDCQRQGGLEKVEIVSTVGVGGRLPVVREDWITESRGFHNTYEQAKAEAEELIHSHVLEGLPITVHRPSMVVGHSQTGKIIHHQIFYHLCEFLSGRRTLGLFPPLGGAHLDIVPVDYVARVLAWSSTCKDTTGMILHECSGSDGGVPLNDLRSRVRELFSSSGISLPAILTLPTWAFKFSLLLASGFLGEKNRRAVRTLPVFLDYLASPQVFEDVFTAGMLTDAGIAVAPPWGDYLGDVLKEYLRK